MGASRDLMLSVFVEATFVLSLAVGALIADTTDLRGVVAGTAGAGVWGSPALALGAVAFAFVAIAETGRQPVDNPDTHLELTMIHEGPLLEYARPRSRATCSGPPPHGTGSCSCSPRRSSFLIRTVCGCNSLCSPLALIALCAALAIVETLLAKMRVLLVPRLLAVGVAAALLGIAAWIAGAA